MLALTDLNVSKDLDQAALEAVTGCGMWHLKSRRIYSGRWSAYRMFYSRYQGLRFHDGRIKRKYLKGFTRTRIQREVTYWCQYV